VKCWCAEAIRQARAVAPAPCSTPGEEKGHRGTVGQGLFGDGAWCWRRLHVVSRDGAASSVCYFANLSRAPQDFDHCPCSRTPELQFVGRLTALNSLLNIIKVLPNNVDRPVTVPVDEASSGDPGNTVHGVRIGAESLRQVN
jgi:hypothetical protein